MAAKRSFRTLGPTEEKAEILQAFYNEFKEFDQVLEKLYGQLAKYKDADYMMVLKNAALKALDQAYIRFANNQPLSKCTNSLKEALEAIAIKADEEYKSNRQNQSLLFKLLFKLPKNKLIDILDKAQPVLAKVSMQEEKMQKFIK